MSDFEAQAEMDQITRSECDELADRIAKLEADKTEAMVEYTKLLTENIALDKRIAKLEGGLLKQRQAHAGSIDRRDFRIAKLEAQNKTLWETCHAYAERDAEGAFDDFRKAIKKLQEVDLRKCPHDGGKCTHQCEGDECWRELEGS